MDREAIYTALFARFEKMVGIRTISRRVKMWDEVSEFPAVFQSQKGENVSKQGRGIPSKLEMYVDVYLYAKCEPDGVSAQYLNILLDQVTEAIKAPEPISNKQTLDGLVEDCYIDGQILTDEGVLGDVAIAIVPIHIIAVY